MFFGQTIVIEYKDITFCVSGGTNGTLKAHRIDLVLLKATTQTVLDFIRVQSEYVVHFDCVFSEKYL